jgi:hypothetical protein
MFVRTDESLYKFADCVDQCPGEWKPVDVKSSPHDCGAQSGSVFLECHRIGLKKQLKTRRSNRKTKWLEFCRRFVHLLIPQVDRKWLGQIYS